MNKDKKIEMKSEIEELNKLLNEIKEFLKSTQMENTNVGMKIREKCNDWLKRIGK